MFLYLQILLTYPANRNNKPPPPPPVKVPQKNEIHPLGNLGKIYPPNVQKTTPRVGAQKI